MVFCKSCCYMQPKRAVFVPSSQTPYGMELGYGPGEPVCQAEGFVDPITEQPAQIECRIRNLFCDCPDFKPTEVG